MASDKPRVALVVGAGGLVGAELVRALAAGDEYSRVIAITRRPLPFEAPRLANRILNFDRLEDELRGVACDDAFCCLGTTIREAGSQAAFRAVDLDLVLRFARCAQSAGAKTMVAVSSVDAAPQSRNFYLRVKGEMELGLEALRFRSLHLMQPSLLLGARGHWRPAEAAARALMPLINPLLLGRSQRWRAIPARTVAAAMRAAALSARLGVYRHTWQALQALARSGGAPVRL
jgi:uncharacterized protein YbjT (DUF2867 family)